jgi:hypothetical protein
MSGATSQIHGFTACSARNTSYGNSFHHSLIHCQRHFLRGAEDPALAAVMGIGLLECDLQNVKRETLIVQLMTSAYMSVIFCTGKGARQLPISSFNPAHMSYSYNPVLSPMTHAYSPRLFMGVSLNNAAWGLPTTPVPCAQSKIVLYANMYYLRPSGETQIGQMCHLRHPST